MNKKGIRSALKQKIGQADTYYRLVLAQFDKEDIHHFRVEIKKLKAFLRMLDSAARHPGKFRLPKPVRRFYQSLGRLRSLQLQHELVSAQAKESLGLAPETYLNTLNLQIARSIGKSRRRARKIKSLPASTRILQRRVPKSLDAATIEKFIRFEFDNLMGILALKNPSAESLHLARKIMKEIYFDWSYLGAGARSVFPEAIRNKTDFGEFTDQLGTYHDSVVAISLLDRISGDKRAGEAERVWLINLGNEWEAERDEIRESLLRKVRQMGLRPPEGPVQDQALPQSHEHDQISR